jgi:hypothetical protein
MFLYLQSMVVELAKADSNSLCIQQGHASIEFHRCGFDSHDVAGLRKNNSNRPHNSYDSMTPALEQV